MSITTIAIVLCAAILHATWNAMVKGGNDPRQRMAAVTFGHVPFAIMSLVFVPTLSTPALPYLAMGAVFHFGYQFYLIKSYRLGDLSQAYPVARASAPVFASVVSLLFLDGEITALQFACIGVIALGLVSTLGWRVQNIPRAAALAAFTTGGFIASYSLADGIGGRVGQSPVAFYAWLSLINAVVMWIYMRSAAPDALRTLPTQAGRVFWGGGFASFTAYAMVMWAFFHAPIPVVMAMRETSILFAFAIGIFFLGEKFTLAKLIGTILTVSGIILLRLVG